MADTDAKISDLVAAESLSESDLFEIEQGTSPDNHSRKGTLGQLRQLSLISPVNEQTGTEYTLVLTDAFKLVLMDNANANTITVPPNSSVAFPVGVRVDIGQEGAGQTSVVAGTGVTVNTPETLKIAKQFGKATLIYLGSDVWDLEGRLEAST